MQKMKGGGFTHIRVHLLRILWRDGGFTYIRVHPLRILCWSGNDDMENILPGFRKFPFPI